MAARPWQDALLDAAVMAPREVPRARSVLALLAEFASGQGVPASPQWLLDYDVVEAFCVRGCAGRAPATRGTYRSVLYQLARQVHGSPGQRATPFPGAGAPVPYSALERAELAAAAAQRDAAKRSSALAMVVFGIGAGLRPGELAALRGSDVTRHGRQVVIDVTAGAGRVVPPAARYAGRAAGLAVCRIVPSCPWVFCGGQRRDPGLVGILWGRQPAPPRLASHPACPGDGGKANPGHSAAMTGATQMVTSDRNSYPDPKPTLEHAEDAP